jgi:ankyrin repeat protein
MTTLINLLKMEHNKRTKNWQQQVDKLIEEKVNINFIDENGKTALWYAREKNETTIIEKLISVGAIEEPKNLTALAAEIVEKIAQRIYRQDLSILQKSAHFFQPPATNNLWKKNILYYFPHTDATSQAELAMWENIFEIISAKEKDQEKLNPTQKKIFTLAKQGQVKELLLVAEKFDTNWQKICITISEKEYHFLNSEKIKMLNLAKEGKVKELLAMPEFNFHSLNDSDARGQYLLPWIINKDCQIMLDRFYKNFEKDKFPTPPQIIFLANLDFLQQINEDVQQKIYKLYVAIYLRQDPQLIIKQLSTIDANIVNQATNIHTLMYYAAATGHVEAMKQLIALGNLDINSMNGNYHTPLEAAALYGQTEIVKELISLGALVDHSKYYNWPLLYAVNSGDAETVQILVDSKTNVDAINCFSKKPILMIAVESGYVKIVKILIKSGANIEAVDEQHQQTSLFRAAASNNMEMLLVLISSGANVEATDVNGITALAAAAKLGRTKIAIALLYNGANVDAVDEQGRTALSYAAENGHLEIASKLLIKNTKFDDVDDDGRTPLSYAAKNGHLAVAKELLNNEATVDAVDKQGRTALSYAAENGHLEIASKLLIKNAKFDDVDDDGRTPLSYAAKNGHLAVAKELLNNGATVDAFDNEGRTTVSYAAEMGHVETVLELLNRNAMIEASDAFGRKPLHYAVQKGDLPMVMTLLNKGANVNATDKEGRTLLSCAAGNKKIIAVLKGDIPRSNNAITPYLVKEITQSHNELKRSKFFSRTCKESREALQALETASDDKERFEVLRTYVVTNRQENKDRDLYKIVNKIMSDYEMNGFEENIQDMEPSAPSLQ